MAHMHFGLIPFTACGDAVGSRAMHISMLFHGQESPSHGILLAVVSFAFISLAFPVVVLESRICPVSDQWLSWNLRVTSMPLRNEARMHPALN